MLILHLVAGAGVAVLSGGASLALGQGMLATAGAYALGGAAGLLASAAVAAMRSRGDDAAIAWEDEPDWTARRRRAAAEPRVVPLRPARPSAPTRIGDRRLAPDWMAERRSGGAAEAWPDDPPADLRLRLLDALALRGAGPEEVWDEMRGWLVEHGIGCPADLRDAGRRP